MQVPRSGACVGAAEEVLRSDPALWREPPGGTPPATCGVEAVPEGKAVQQLRVQEVAVHQMKPLSVDDIRALLPDLDDLRPFMDDVIAVARPDQDRRWSGAGELGTLGERLVDADEIEARIPRVLEEVQGRLKTLYAAVSRAVRAMAEDRPEAALHELMGAAENEQAVGRLVEAETLAQAALRLTTRFRDRAVALPALIAGARIARAVGRWELAERRYRDAFHLARDVGDAATAATAAIGAGNLAVDRGLWNVARRRYEEADPWVAQLEPDASERWHLELNRSIVARREGDLERAQRHLSRAETLLGDRAKPRAEAVLANARGKLLRATGRDEEAEVAFRHALDNAGALDAQVTIAVNLAEVLLALGHSLEAGDVARQAEELAISNAVIPRLPEVYRTLGKVAAARGHADAFVFFERALAVVRERHLPEFERAQVLEVYGRYDRVRGEDETGRARLLEAGSLYEDLGCRLAMERVQTELTSGDSQESLHEENQNERDND